MPPGCLGYTLCIYQSYAVRRAHEYHGEAVNPAYLSVFERMVGRGKHYNPELALQDAKGKSYENEMPGGPVNKA